MHQVHSHYENLSVARNAPPEVIRAAYRVLAQKHHPDRMGQTDEAKQIMQLINDAYRVLSDPVLKGEHDRWIAAQAVFVGAKINPPMSTTDSHEMPSATSTRRTEKEKSSKFDEIDLDIAYKNFKSKLPLYVFATFCLLGFFLLFVVSRK